MQSPGIEKDNLHSIVLVGFMAAGKSKIGRALAVQLGLPFVDVDRLIEADQGCSIADIFRDRGEPAFRQAERSAILRLLGDQPQVIAVGGGAFVDETNRNALNGRARTIWIDTPFELILQRLSGSTSRPLAARMNESELRELWTERSAAYLDAHVRIDTSDADVERIVERIVSALA